MNKPDHIAGAGLLEEWWTTINSVHEQMASHAVNTLDINSEMALVRVHLVAALETIERHAEDTDQ